MRVPDVKRLREFGVENTSPLKPFADCLLRMMVREVFQESGDRPGARNQVRAFQPHGYSKVYGLQVTRSRRLSSAGPADAGTEQNWRW